MNTILKLLVSAVEGPLLAEGTAGLDNWLEAQYQKAPKRTAMLVSVVHAGLKGEAEDLAKKTSFQYDDDAVAAAEKELEAFAQKHNFELATFPEE